MEVKQQSGALGLKAEPQLGRSPNPDISDNGSKTWIIEETKFAHRNMVYSFYLVKM